MDYESEKQKALELYKSFNIVFCNALQKEVVFNQKGFKHIIYKKGRHVRDVTSQIARFKLLGLSKQLIEITTTIQEYSFENVEGLEHYYWGFIAIMSNKKVKVIVRKVGNGAVHFWSIIPDWKTNNKRDHDQNILFMKGNPEID